MDALGYGGVRPRDRGQTVPSSELRQALLVMFEVACVERGALEDLAEAIVSGKEGRELKVAARKAKLMLDRAYTARMADPVEWLKVHGTFGAVRDGE